MPRFFLGNLSYNIDETSLTAALQQAGVTVANLKIIRDRETGGSRGFGFAEVREGGEEDALLALAGTTVAGRPLQVQPAKEQERRGRGGGSSRPVPSDDWGESEGGERRRGRR